LWENTHELNTGDEIRRRWGWMDHTLQKSASTITRQAGPTMEPTKKNSWARNMRRRDLLTDTKMTGYSWRELEKKLRDDG